MNHAFKKNVITEMPASNAPVSMLFGREKVQSKMTTLTAKSSSLMLAKQEWLESKNSTVGLQDAKND
ncbi:hypothetical protein FCH79_04450 [Pseudomonas koreensis]|uniref:hypothetical protein n=1 Tax=Pseudomonas TaxID=286 RepID=UPI001121EECE|nr:MULTISPECIES: hypothetical protein [Pseudomonas]NTZ94574.1 hypothetical protein [Pseudomonas koreensis]